MSPKDRWCKVGTHVYPLPPFQTEEVTVDQTARSPELDDLEPSIGQWRMTPTFLPKASDAPRQYTTFTWLAGRRFLIQRWEVEHPDAPDGIAIIGFDPATTTYLPALLRLSRNYQCVRDGLGQQCLDTSRLPSTPTSLSASSGAFVGVAADRRKLGAFDRQGCQLVSGFRSHLLSQAGLTPPYAIHGCREKAPGVRALTPTVGGTAVPPATEPERSEPGRATSLVCLRRACPRQESNLGHSFRKRVLYPLSYVGG